MADADKSRSGRSAGKKSAAKATRSSNPRPAMSESESKPGSVFELDRIRKLVELMEEHDLTEVDLSEDEQAIRICRGPRTVAGPATYVPAAPQPAPSATAGNAAASAPPPKAADGANIAVIKSPMVGTFYSRANPKAEPYVKVGDRVDASTIVCIIEAMKVFNEIPAEVRGKIVAILPADGEAVEFDKPLFKVDTSG
jgi:acetyl-CoA carboxylase biotin carboxyl carrier protein